MQNSTIKTENRYADDARRFQGHRDGYNNDRPAECRKDFTLEGAGGKTTLQVQHRFEFALLTMISMCRAESLQSSTSLHLAAVVDVLSCADLLGMVMRSLSFANIAQYSSIPTVGFNMKRVQKGHVTLKCWDLGGQPRFRSMWERYCRGVNAIVFIVDSADTEALPVAKEELHALLEKPVLEGIPLLVLGNKSDLEEKLSVDEIIEALDLKSILHREVSCYGISAKEETNLDAVLQWLVNRPSK